MTEIKKVTITIEPSWRGGGIGYGEKMLLEMNLSDKEKFYVEFFLTLKDIDNALENKKLFEEKIGNFILEAKELFWKSLNDKYGA